MENPSVTIIKTQDTVYLKEITAPQGYVVNATATNVKLVASKTSAVTVENKEQLAELTVYKEGQVLTGAEVSESGTVFHYENRRRKKMLLTCVCRSRYCDCVWYKSVQQR